jgi:tRNA A37 methylthiotransferase MiaB
VLDGQVSPETRLERAARVGEAVDRVAARHWEGLVGRSVEALVERGARGQAAEGLGRIAAQAPDVDGIAVLRGSDLRRGQLRRARIVSTQGYDVTAEVEE